MNRKLFGTTVLLTSMIGLSVFCGEPCAQTHAPAATTSAFVDPTRAAPAQVIARPGAMGQGYADYLTNPYRTGLHSELFQMDQRA